MRSGHQSDGNSAAARLRAGERIRPMGAAWGVACLMLLVFGVAVGFATAVSALVAGDFSGWVSIVGRLAAATIGPAVLVWLGPACLTRLRGALQLSPEALTYWNWRGREHRVGWEQIHRIMWEQPWRSRILAEWKLALCYRDAGPGTEPRLAIVLDAASGWRVEVAEALRDEIVTRGGLQLAEGDADQDGDKVWVRPEEQS